MTACTALLTRGPNKGKPATGSRAGYDRHVRAGEYACEPCLAAASGRQPGVRYRRKAEPKNEPLRRKSKLVGRQSVRCRGCGTRGVANMAFVGRSRAIDSCVNCRGKGQIACATCTQPLALHSLLGGCP